MLTFQAAVSVSFVEHLAQAAGWCGSISVRVGMDLTEYGALLTRRPQVPEEAARLGVGIGSLGSAAGWLTLGTF